MGGRKTKLQQEGSGAAAADSALLVKQALHLLEDAMESVELPSSKAGVTRKGDYVYALFEHAGITCDNAQARTKGQRPRACVSVTVSTCFRNTGISVPSFAPRILFFHHL